MKAYKVVRKKDEKLLSYVSGLFLAEVEYKIGKKTTPRPLCGPLACFTDLKSAVMYVVMDHHKSSSVEIDWNFYEIYECEISPVKNTVLFNGMHSTIDISVFPGAIAANYVVLRNKIEPETFPR